MDKNKEIKVEENEEFVTLTDENGKEYQFELIGHGELKGTEFYAFVPAGDDASDDGFLEYTILKLIKVNGEEELVSIDDDDEFDDVADYFDDLLSQEIDYDA